MSKKKAGDVLKDATRKMKAPPASTSNTLIESMVSTKPGRLLTKVVRFGEVHLRVYSIGYLAMALDRSTHTIRRWERNKLIPKPLVHTQDGARWYLKEEIDKYSKLAKQYNVQTGFSIEQTGFPEALKLEMGELEKRVTKTIQAGVSNEGEDQPKKSKTKSK